MNLRMSNSNEKMMGIGLMSGTSLDGIDLAACNFWFENGKYAFEIVVAETFPYDSEWHDRLKFLPQQDAVTYVKTHVELGHLYGNLLNEFINKHQLKASFIASHGHTIFHQPSNKFTAQIGDLAAIAAINTVPVIGDFRTIDVALGGQGAPLVPIGDRLLFHEYQACLNLGGIANISFEKNSERVAFDICPVNMILNSLATLLDKNYDDQGLIARSGAVNNDLLYQLNNLDFYHINSAKSLGREWFENEFSPIVASSTVKLEDKLCTCVEHIAQQIALSIQENQLAGKMLITGGGAFNNFLIERIQARTTIKTIIPDAQTIAFKEALIFAFLGLLKFQNKINVLGSSTGSKKDHVGGCIYFKVQY